MELRSDPLRWRWVVWAVLATAFLVVSVHRLSTAVLAADLMRAFETTGAALGTLHASFFYVYAPMQVVAGVLADRLGIRKTATIGTVVMSVGGLGFGLAESYPVAFVARVAIGLGAGVVFIATIRFCANWYRPGEFATMNGLTVGMSGLGAILATTPLALAVAALGVRASIVGIGLAGLLLAAVIWVFARDTPNAAGFDPLSDVQSAPTLTIRDVGRNLRTVLTERETWLAGLALFTSTGVNLTVIGLWGIPYIAQVYDRSVTVASTLTLLGSVGLLLGPPLLGRLSDRLGRRTDLMVVGAVAYTAAFAVPAVVVDPPLPVVGLVFFGASALTGTYALGYTVVKNRHGAAASGVATGAVNAIGFLGAALFPTVMGAILDAYWTGETVAGARVYTTLGYRVMFALAAAAGLVSLLCVAYLHLLMGRDSTSDPDTVSA